MELHVPGADIVGFEYEPASTEDRALVEAAEETLKQPADLFVLPVAAECTVIEAAAHLEGEGGHEDHDDHDEGHDDHDEDHDDHAEEHADHDEDDHDEEHAHEEHAQDAEHDEHDHENHADDHAEDAGHTEFHAEYVLSCAHPEALTDITFGYFEAFPNALEVDVQLITDSGATSFEVERDAPVLDLRSAL
jgi:hypothetical protein